MGLLAAAVLAIVFIAIVWISMGRGTAPTAINPELFPTDESEIPNIADAQTGGAMLVTMVDKNDPTRVAGTLRADRFEPIGGGRRRLDNPESWIFLKDGRAIRVTADSATMLMPDPEEAPESGTLEGHITIQAFDSTPAAGAQARPDDSPTMTARFDDPVEFERRYLRLRSAGHFDITSSQFDFSGRDLTVILNELRNRVELIDVIEGDRLVIHARNQSNGSSDAAMTDDQTQDQTQDQMRVQTPVLTASETPPSDRADDRVAAQPGSGLAQGEVNTATPTGTADGSTPAPADPFTRYHVTLSDQVRALIGTSASAAADRLELWAALEGGALPDDAIRKLDLAPRPAKIDPMDMPPAQAAAPDDTDAPPRTLNADPPSPAADPSAARPDDDIVITWTGSMSVRPIDDAIPAQLAADDLTLMLAADDGEGVSFAVPDRGFEGQSFAATYHATRSVLVLDSAQSDAGIIRLRAAGTGSLVASSLRADLATGLIDLGGRGTLTSTPADATDEQASATIEWRTGAAFELAMIDEALSDRLARARFDGTVMARQAGSTLGARSLDARFDPARQPEVSLTKLSMIDGVLTSSSRSILSGKNLGIDFAPRSDGSSVDPIRLEAHGQVLGRDPESMLKTENLIATMHRDLMGDLVVRTADAEGDIRFTGVDRTRAEGDTLSVDGVNESMILTGADARVAQAGSSIVGEHITIHTRRRGIEVLGPGSFDHDITLKDAGQSAPAAGHLKATWKGSMRFDDAIGSIVCEEGVRVVSTPDAFTLDTLDAHRAEIKITPVPSNDPIGGGAGPAPSRELLSARIFGRAPTGGEPIPARIESRTYARDNPQLVISLLYLDGPQILINNTAQTLDVPAPGTLLVMDKSAAREQMPEPQEQTGDDAPPAPILALGEQSLTRFTWAGRLNLDRAKGTARMSDGVVVRQKSITSGKIAQLETDRLDAAFELGSPDQSQTSRLLGATASGRVRFIYEGRELLADEARYDAIEDSLFASAIDNRLVTLYDDAEPAPVSAKTMKWDLTRDRIEINAPAPVRAPGG